MHQLESRPGCNIVNNCRYFPKPFEPIEELGGSCTCLQQFSQCSPLTRSLGRIPQRYLKAVWELELPCQSESHGFRPLPCMIMKLIPKNSQHETHACSAAMSLSYSDDLSSSSRLWRTTLANPFSINCSAILLGSKCQFHRHAMVVGGES